MKFNAPTIVGFDILQRLGGGPISQVASAVHRGTGEKFAVKWLGENWIHEDVARGLFEREIEVLLAMDHPHVVKGLEASGWSLPPFLVMELLHGTTLRKRLSNQGRISIATGIEWMWQTASGLNALHQSGFIHGDIKPENLFGDDRLVKIIDLGFAHRPGENQHFCEQGYTLGTANYLAPELCGHQGIDDFAGDIFSFGVTFFELFTGQLPYASGTVLETLHRHQEECPARLNDFLGEWPPALVTLFDEMMARDPLKRPHAIDILHTLQDWDMPVVRRVA
jgi:eukaryotic-like serine/threonine-protein kinase